MTNKLKPIKGFRDFYPQDWAFQTWLRDNWLELGKSFGYQEYEGPLLERLNLYLSKTSQEIVEKQTFRFTEKDKNYILRPELTPTLARMIAQKQYRIPLPAKWQSYGRFFRYESPQKGRGRSFFQWNIDLLGAENVEADSEIIALACQSLKKLGFTFKEVQIKLNNRQALENIISKNLAISREKARKLFKYIDKVDKMPKKEWLAWLKDEGFKTDKINKLILVLEDDNKNFSPWLNKIMANIKEYSLEDYIVVDKSLVRGFQYYTKTVFEAWSIDSSLNRALFGGGRYDNLTQQVGGQKKIPGVGFAIGDMPIYELLKEKNKLPQLKTIPTKVLVTIFSPEMQSEAFKTAQELRQSGVNTELYLNSEDNLSDQLDYANDKNIPYTIIIGPEEAEKNVVSLKNMSTGKQQTSSLEEIIKSFKSK